MVKRVGGASLQSISIDRNSSKTIASQLCSALRDLILGAVRAIELRKLFGHVARITHEQLAARVEQTALAPARGRYLFRDDNAQAMRPRTLHAHSVDPRNRRDRLAHAFEIDAHQSDFAHLLFHYALDIRR